MKAHLLCVLLITLTAAGCGTKPIRLSQSNGNGDESNWTYDPESEHPSIGQFSTLSIPEMTLSPGDRIAVVVPDGDLFDGTYEVNADGNIQLPMLPRIHASGKTCQQLAKQVEIALVQMEIFRASYVSVSISPRQWSALQVVVSGAVFNPGRHLINQRPVAERMQQSTQQSGDYPTGRFLSEALRAAGGIRPDADISRVELVRQGDVLVFDLRGIFSGTTVPDVPLMAGDQIVVPSGPKLLTNLMRASQITPKGFQIFISNLTVPSDSNAQAAVGKVTRSMPYGTRLLRGLVAANCVGGTGATNAGRKAVHISTDFQTNAIKVRERNIADLLTNASDLRLNPYLMPDDGLACFDSGVTNIRDIARSFTDLLNPLLILELIEE